MRKLYPLLLEVDGLEDPQSSRPALRPKVDTKSAVLKGLILELFLTQLKKESPALSSCFPKVDPAVTTSVTPKTDS